mmetsp:Transcript_75242/g.170331  ORF Transcript_75242/g.170331 Transcript_75242/m.170331 type:complete len:133 (-) Transcript_75242:72-470(-)
MARSSTMLRLCAIVAIACLALQSTHAFVSGPQVRGEGVVAAASAAAVASLPGVAGAFVYDGKEYFDITFGISPLAWGCTAFAIVFYGAVLKNAALKYNKPFGTTTIVDPKPPKAGGGFVGMEIEQATESYKA